jgi:hypothetical protein
MSGFEQGRDMVGKVATFKVCQWFLLKSAKDRFLGVDPPPRTTCVATCLVWNDLLNNYVHLRMCLAGDVDDKLSVSLWESARCNWGRLSVSL